MFDDIKNLIKPPQPTAAVPQAAPPSRKILIVEDDTALRQLYVEILTAAGFDVITAENGQAGLAAISSQRPDLVLLDVMMPIMDGKTMLHRVRAMPEFKTLPVIILTNAGDVETMRQTKFFDNANDFLIKSNVTPDEIVSKVKSLLM